MLPHPLTKFKIQKYYQNELKFNGFYSTNNLSKRKDQTYVINLEFKSVEYYWIALYINGNNGITFYDTICFDRFGVNG